MSNSTWTSGHRQHHHRAVRSPLAVVALMVLGLLGVQAGVADPVSATNTAVAGNTVISVNGARSCVVLAAGTVTCWGDGSVARTPVAGLSGVKSVAVGATHTCALLTGGTVKCWGVNDSGQLGDGTRTDRSSPVTALGLTGVTSIAAGMSETCAVLSSGAVKCWGAQTNSNTPALRAGVSGVVAVSVGWHSCALLSTGGVKCWGLNSNGELGNGNTVDSPSPVSVRGISTAIAVTVGNAHSCALLSTRTVKCWGANFFAQLGDGTAVDRLAPVSVVGLTKVMSVTSGNYHTCALTTAGAVKCWGLDEQGQLGDGSLLPGLLPVTANVPAGVVAIAAGGGGLGVEGLEYTAHTCALLSGGSVTCWGSNSGGQLGRGTMSVASAPATAKNLSGATAVAAGANASCVTDSGSAAMCWGNTPGPPLQGVADVTSVSVGSNHTCALVVDTTVRCWGNNQNGELGVDPALVASTGAPMQVAVISNVEQISVGLSTSCAVITGGTVRCWGLGPLGDGTLENSYVPLVVSGITTAVEVSAGDGNACARLVGGTVSCWGLNPAGEVGNGTAETALSPVTVSGLSNVVSISMGAGSACAAVTDGSVFCWGRNMNGSLGDGTSTPSSSPVQVSGISTAIGVAVGGYNNTGFGLTPSVAHACALMQGGAVKCWGANGRGQLGNGSTADSFAPVDVSGITSATALSLGWRHSCALVAGGVVKCWGDNLLSQVGDGPSYPDQVAVPGVSTVRVLRPTISSVAPVVVRPGSKVTITGTEFAGATAVKFGGVAASTFSVVGNDRIIATVPPAGASGAVSVTTPTGTATSTAALASIAAPTQLAAGDTHSCARLASGAAVCWGTNSSGQLGNGTLSSSVTPVLVSGLANATSVVAGGSFTCARIADTTARCWGGNGSGQLGRGSLLTSKTPTVVQGVGSAATLIGVSSLAAGSAFACAVMNAGASGEVRCWGANASGQLGDGTTTQRTRPVVVLASRGVALKGAVAVAAGGSSACALLTTGAVRCWGANSNGQLGRGTLANGLLAAPVSGIDGVSAKASAISVGGVHACAVIVGGQARCWGSNSGGQLGDGTLVQRTTPVPVLTAAGVRLTGANTLAAGGSATCARSGTGAGARVRCWGSDALGQLGNSVVGSTKYAALTFGTLTNGATALVAGRNHMLALVPNPAMTPVGVAGWGSNGSGQAGDGTTTNRTVPTRSPWL